MTAKVEDISSLSRVVHQLDASATLRSFAAPGAVVAAWVVALSAIGASLADDYGYFDASVLFGALAVVLFATASAPLVILYDAFARQPWRAVSSAIALVAGGLAHAVYGAGAVALALVALALPFDAGLREEIGFFFGDLTESGVSPALIAVAGVAALVAYVVLPIWALRRTVQIETVLAGATPRAVLLGDLGGAGFWTRLAYVSGIPSSLWHAEALGRPELWLFLAARTLIYLIAIPINPLLGEIARLQYGDALFGVLAVSILAIIALLVAGHVAYAFAKRLAARRIWAEPAPDSRKPILFLRSFENDQFDFHPSPLDLVGRWLALWSFRRNADEMLIDEFARDGEVIALGQPGEARTPFGASRRYVTHEDWQKVVRTAAAEAPAIVVAAGKTPGLVWEYKLIGAADYLGKTIFLFPPAPPGAENVEQTLSLFRQAFPAIPLEPPAGKALIALTAGPDGPKLIVADKPTPAAYLLALRAFVQQRDLAAGVRVGDEPMPFAALVAGPIGLAAGFMIGLSMASGF